MIDELALKGFIFLLHCIFIHNEVLLYITAHPGITCSDTSNRGYLLEYAFVLGPRQLNIRT